MSRPRFDRTPLLFENYTFSRKYVVFRLLLKRSLKKTGRDDYFDERVQGKKALAREKNEKEKRDFCSTNRSDRLYFWITRLGDCFLLHADIVLIPSFISRQRTACLYFGSCLCSRQTRQSRQERGSSSQIVLSKETLFIFAQQQRGYLQPQLHFASLRTTLGASR